MGAKAQDNVWTVVDSQQISHYVLLMLKRFPKRVPSQVPHHGNPPTFLIFVLFSSWACIIYTVLKIKSNVPHWRDWPQHLLLAPSSCPYVCLCEELFLFLSYPLAEVPNGALVFIIRKERKIICQTPWWSYLVENLLTVKWYHIKEGRKNFKLSISAQKKSVCLRGDSITPHHQIKRPWGNGNFHELLRGVQKKSWMPFCFIFFQTYSFLSRRNPPNVFCICD